jgi:murein DD-endopeptidase MepM/ murein hydrolase activator NlpD
MKRRQCAPAIIVTLKLIVKKREMMRAGILVGVTLIITLISGLGLLSLVARPGQGIRSGSEEASSVRPAQSQDDPRFVCREFFSPFLETDRKNLRLLRRRMSGRYGDYRRSFKPGHLHAGIDLRGDFGETVYPVGRGFVELVFRDFPHKSVAVKHILPDGAVLYSMYVHLEEIRVEEGDAVTEKTPLARLFNRGELEKSDFGTANHLHLEIRKSLEDGGWASASSMTMEELNRFCLDPLEFFRKRL